MKQRKSNRDNNNKYSYNMKKQIKNSAAGIIMSVLLLLALLLPDKAAAQVLVKEKDGDFQSEYASFYEFSQDFITRETKLKEYEISLTSDYVADERDEEVNLPGKYNTGLENPADFVTKYTMDFRGHNISGYIKFITMSNVKVTYKGNDNPANIAFVVAYANPGGFLTIENCNLVVDRGDAIFVGASGPNYDKSNPTPYVEIKNGIIKSTNGYAINIQISGSIGNNDDNITTVMLHGGSFYGKTSAFRQYLSTNLGDRLVWTPVLADGCKYYVDGEPKEITLDDFPYSEAPYKVDGTEYKFYPYYHKTTLYGDWPEVQVINSSVMLYGSDDKLLGGFATFSDLFASDLIGDDTYTVKLGKDYVSKATPDNTLGLEHIEITPNKKFVFNFLDYEITGDGLWFEIDGSTYIKYLGNKGVANISFDSDIVNGEDDAVLIIEDCNIVSTRDYAIIAEPDMQVIINGGYIEGRECALTSGDTYTKNISPFILNGGHLVGSVSAFETSADYSFNTILFPKLGEGKAYYSHGLSVTASPDEYGYDNDDFYIGDLTSPSWTSIDIMDDDPVFTVNLSLKTEDDAIPLFFDKDCTVSEMKFNTLREAMSAPGSLNGIKVYSARNTEKSIDIYSEEFYLDITVNKDYKNETETVEARTNTYTTITNTNGKTVEIKGIKVSGESARLTLTGEGNWIGAGNGGDDPFISKESGELTIEDGNFECDDSYLCVVQSSQTTINISGGKFKGGRIAALCVDANAIITGGYFKGEYGLSTYYNAGDGSFVELSNCIFEGETRAINSSYFCEYNISILADGAKFLDKDGNEVSENDATNYDPELPYNYIEVTAPVSHFVATGYKYTEDGDGEAVGTKVFSTLTAALNIDKYDEKLKNADSIVVSLDDELVVYEDESDSPTVKSDKFILDLTDSKGNAKTVKIGTITWGGNFTIKGPIDADGNPVSTLSSSSTIIKYYGQYDSYSLTLRDVKLVTGAQTAIYGPKDGTVDLYNAKLSSDAESDIWNNFISFWEPPYGGSNNGTVNLHNGAEISSDSRTWIAENVNLDDDCEIIAIKDEGNQVVTIDQAGSETNIKVQKAEYFQLDVDGNKVGVYPDLRAAIAEAGKHDGTADITLLKDYHNINYFYYNEQSKGYYFDDPGNLGRTKINKDIKIVLKEHSCSDTIVFDIVDGAKLSIEADDNAEIYAKFIVENGELTIDGGIYDFYDDVFDIRSDGKVTINSGTFNGSRLAGPANSPDCLYNIDNPEGGLPDQVAFAENQGVLTILGGTFKEERIKKEDADVYYGNTAQGIINYSSGKLTIGTEPTDEVTPSVEPSITTTNSVFKIDGGEATFYSGDFTCDDDHNINMTSGAGKATVKGGSFTSSHADAINSMTGDLDISGGVFVGVNGVMVNDNSGHNTVVNISGGYFGSTSDDGYGLFINGINFKKSEISGGEFDGRKQAVYYDGYLLKEGKIFYNDPDGGDEVQESEGTVLGNGYKYLRVGDAIRHFEVLVDKISQGEFVDLRAAIKFVETKPEITDATIHMIGNANYENPKPFFDVKNERGYYFDDKENKGRTKITKNITIQFSNKYGYNNDTIVFDIQRNASLTIKTGNNSNLYSKFIVGEEATLNLLDCQFSFFNKFIEAKAGSTVKIAPINAETIYGAKPAGANGYYYDIDNPESQMPDVSETELYFVYNNGGKVTVRDNVAFVEYKPSGTEPDYKFYGLWNKSGTMDVGGTSVTSTLDALHCESGKLSAGGTFTSTDGNAYYTKGGGTLHEGGSFEGINAVVIDNHITGLSNYDKANTLVRIDGGTFTATGTSDGNGYAVKVLNADSYVEIQGGEFTGVKQAIYNPNELALLIDGFAYRDRGSNLVMEPDAYRTKDPYAWLKVEELPFSFFSVAYKDGAVMTAKEGKKLEFRTLADALKLSLYYNLSGTGILESEPDSVIVAMIDDKSPYMITSDLAEVSSGNFILDLGDDYSAQIRRIDIIGGSLKINSGTIKSEAKKVGTGGRLEDWGAIMAKGGSLEINGGTVSGYYSGVYVDGANNVKINGGSIESNAPSGDGVRSVVSAMEVAAAGQVDIKGGNFKGLTYGLYNQSSVTLYGGEFACTDSENGCAITNTNGDLETLLADDRVLLNGSGVLVAESTVVGTNGNAELSVAKMLLGYYASEAATKPEFLGNSDKLALHGTYGDKLKDFKLACVKESADGKSVAYQNLDLFKESKNDAGNLVYAKYDNAMETSMSTIETYPVVSDPPAIRESFYITGYKTFENLEIIVEPYEIEAVLKPTIVWDESALPDEVSANYVTLPTENVAGNKVTVGDLKLSWEEIQKMTDDNGLAIYGIKSDATNFKVTGLSTIAVGPDGKETETLNSVLFHIDPVNSGLVSLYYGDKVADTVKYVSLTDNKPKVYYHKAQYTKDAEGKPVLVEPTLKFNLPEFPVVDGFKVETTENVPVFSELGVYDASVAITDGLGAQTTVSASIRLWSDNIKETNTEEWKKEFTLEAPDNTCLSVDTVFTPGNQSVFVDFTDNGYVVDREGFVKLSYQLKEKETDPLADKGYTCGRIISDDEITVMVDKTPPTLTAEVKVEVKTSVTVSGGSGYEDKPITLSSDPDKQETYFITTGTELTITASDKLSHVNSITISGLDANEQDDSIFVYKNEKADIIYLKLSASDVAGNVSSEYDEDEKAMENVSYYCTLVFFDEAVFKGSTDTISNTVPIYYKRGIDNEPQTYELGLNGNSIFAVVDENNNDIDFSGEFISLSEDYLNSLAPGSHELLVYINPMDQRGWTKEDDVYTPANYESQVMKLTLNVDYKVQVDTSSVTLASDYSGGVFCENDKASLSFKLDKNFSLADKVSIPSMQAEGQIVGDEIVVGIVVPEDHVPGKLYDAEFSLAGNTQASYTAAVSPKFNPGSSSYVKLSDVLWTIDNSDSHFGSNGSYVWYLDGEELPGQTSQFLYIAPEMLPGVNFGVPHSVYADVLVDGQSMMKVCPSDDLKNLMFQKPSGKSLVRTAKAYPNPAMAGEEFSLELGNFDDEDFPVLEIRIYGQLGNLQARISDVQKINSLSLPAGAYTGMVLRAGAPVVNFKLIVK